MNLNLPAHMGLAPLGLTLYVLSMSAHAAVLFDQTYDAARLSGGAGVTLSGDRAASVSGDTTLFAAGSVELGNILEIALFSAGQLSEGEQYTVTISISENRNVGSADTDPEFVLSDGTNYLGITHADNNGGAFDPIGGALGSSGGVTTLTGFSYTPDIVNDPREDWIMQFQVGLVDSVALLSPTLADASPASLDVSQGLSFGFFGNNAVESYGLRSVAITVEGPAATAQVPTPAPLALAALAIMGFAWRRGRD
ncbi:MAG: hypothetical protein ACPGU7_07250 [Gammaproteobacteria bacterium]